MFTDSFLLLWNVGWLVDANNLVYHFFNDAAGHSWILDQFLGLALGSNLVKAGVVSACFMFAWLAGNDTRKLAARRKILLITLLSSVFVLAATKSLSKSVFLPRPFILSAHVFHLEGDQLVETPRLRSNVPLDEDSQKSFREMQQGQIFANDLGTFPSDHAGFFITIALGIYFACRRAGLIALVWTMCVPLAAKIMLGQHFPLDIMAGAGIGVVILLSMQLLLGRWGGLFLDPITKWSLRNSSLSAALLFLVLFEVAGTLENVRKIGKVGKDVAKHMMGRQ